MGRQDVIRLCRTGLKHPYETKALHGRRAEMRYLSLHSTTRLIIGIVQCTTMQWREIAELLNVDVDELEDTWDMFLADEKVRSVIEDRLPGAYAAPLPEGKSVKCPTCHGKLTAVPCIGCYPRANSGYKTELAPLAADRFDPPEDPNGWIVSPGSPEKVELMRWRYEVGYQVFCSTDRPPHLTDEPHDAKKMDLDAIDGQFEEYLNDVARRSAEQQQATAEH